MPSEITQSEGGKNGKGILTIKPAKDKYPKEKSPNYNYPYPTNNKNKKSK
jgi:hypothetical protein